MSTSQHNDNPTDAEVRAYFAREVEAGRWQEDEYIGFLVKGSLHEKFHEKVKSEILMYREGARPEKDADVPHSDSGVSQEAK